MDAFDEFKMNRTLSIVFFWSWWCHFVHLFGKSHCLFKDRFFGQSVTDAFFNT